MINIRQRHQNQPLWTTYSQSIAPELAEFFQVLAYRSRWTGGVEQRSGRRPTIYLGDIAAIAFVLQALRQCMGKQVRGVERLGQIVAHRG